MFNNNKFAKKIIFIFSVLTLITIKGNTNNFGSYAQEVYQADAYGIAWTSTLHYAYDTTSRFNNELDDTDTKKFYYNLHGQKSSWESPGDWEIETVDLVWAYTHGSITTNSAHYAMWDYETIANTSSMRLGDEKIGLSILSTFSCQTLGAGYGPRWINVFKGGLRYLTGSHDKLWYGITVRDSGEDYADGLQAGKAIKYAWAEGLMDWYYDQDVAAITSGINCDICFIRMDMTWSSFKYSTRFRDNDIGCLCRVRWNNL